MSKKGLSEIFGLVPKRTYWNMPDNEELFASDIKIKGLPLRLDYNRIKKNFAISAIRTMPNLSNVNLSYIPKPDGDTITLSIHVDAIADCKKLNAAIESALNHEFRTQNLVPDYIMEAGLDESLIDNIVNRNYGSDDGDGPTMA